MGKETQKGTKTWSMCILVPETPENETSLVIFVAVCFQFPISKAKSAGFTGREGGNRTMNSSLLPPWKQSAPRTCLSSVVMEGDEQPYFTLPDPWSTSIISSPVPPHASGEDPSRFIGGWFWITSPQGNFPPNTHESEVDLYPTYNRLYSLETASWLQPRCHCWNWRFGLV